MHTILKDFRGSPDGSTVVDYAAGTVVELTPSLAAVAVAEGWAAPQGAMPDVPTPAPARKPRKKSESPAP